MGNYGAARAYSQVGVRSQGLVASPARLVMMLLDGAITRMGAGEAAIAAKDFEKKHEHLTKAMDIVAALKASLDMEKGGSLSKNLAVVYEFVERSLLLVIGRNDLELLGECRARINTIREGWAEVVNQNG